MSKDAKKEELIEMANRIKERRKSLNYKQEQFAEMIDISLSSYTRIENAFQKPSLDTLKKISIHLKISLDYIVFGESNTPICSTTEEEMLAALLDFSDMDKIKHTIEMLNIILKIKEGR